MENGVGKGEERNWKGGGGRQSGEPWKKKGRASILGEESEMKTTQEKKQSRGEWQDEKEKGKVSKEGEGSRKQRWHRRERQASNEKRGRKEQGGKGNRGQGHRMRWKRQTRGNEAWWAPEEAREGSTSTQFCCESPQGDEHRQI